MPDRKQQLLKAHRRRKRLVLLVAVLLLAVIGVLAPWWCVPLLLLLGWVAHEAWFSDHLFYSPGDDYSYAFGDHALSQDVTLADDGRLLLAEPLPAGETLILQVHVRASLLGRWVDPYVMLGDDRQDFERGVNGRRYLNLSGQAALLGAGELRVQGRFCQLSGPARLTVQANPDYASQPLMVLAPHADDAELAAFGLYSRCRQASIVTVTQGEIEAENLQAMGLSKAQAAVLKGRLRAWDSLAVPLWGGVPASQCVQLGYYCLQLPAMAEQPAIGQGSRESGQSDIRSVRQHNPLVLPADTDGTPSWHNLVADLVALLEHFKPEVVVTPHPQLDPHADHVASTRALFEAIGASRWKPARALFYANHLHDNDRWPMGPAGNGIALPPALAPLPADRLWSPVLSAEVQLDKAMALGMQHDLQGPRPFKKRVRRWLQHWLAGRRWPKTGDDEFFRKAVRRHELFWVRDLER
jgi:LmbE family N-acetylglucosaminyl deacetylase